MIKGKPFVKWAGGKRQILDKLNKYVPTNFDTYYEPFVGGGALLFDLAPKKAVINDSNEELMNVYNVLCDYSKYSKMCKLLNKYEASHSEEFYYEIRSMDKEKSFNKDNTSYNVNKERYGEEGISNNLSFESQGGSAGRRGLVDNEIV